MRWVFIRPYNRSPYYDPEIQEPLGLEYLMASRHERGDAVLLLDSALSGWSDTRIARRAFSFQPDAIGFSLTTAQEIESVQAIHSQYMKVINKPGARDQKTTKWLAGGNFISSEPLRAQEMLPAGFTLVRFEGERILQRLAGEGIDPAGGIYEGPAVLDLDGEPFPHRPFAPRVLANGGAFSLQGSRGCCGACHYCSSPGMSDPASKRWRGRSPRHMAEEIELLYKRLDARSFNFVDEDFLGPPSSAGQRAREFAAEIEKRRLNITFGIQVRPITLNEEIIGCLSGVGLNYVFMGIESDDPLDFKRWGRAWSDGTWKTAASLRRYDVEVNAGVLLFHSHSTFEKIRRFASTLHGYRLLNYRTATSRLDAMPGSRFYKEALGREEIVPNAVGPQPRAFVYPGIKALHQDLLAALSPLGPPSMQGLCALVPMLAGRKLSPDGNNPADPGQLRKILLNLDEAVAASLFQLLDFHEKGIGEPGIVSRLRRDNLKTAEQETRGLAACGAAPSFDMLREAIRMDSGL